MAQDSLVFGVVPVKVLNLRGSASNLRYSSATSLQRYACCSLIWRAASIRCSGGTGSLRSLSLSCTNCVMCRPARGISCTHEPTTKPSATGMTCVSPSPESTTSPVKSGRAAMSPFSILTSFTHWAYKASTAWTAIWRPFTLKVSNMISAVSSRFSGVLKGASVRRKLCSSGRQRRLRKIACCRKRSKSSQFSIRPLLTG
mmetsp:Transcript_48251/g.138785  ORF Transcript_48251/g.138785 Transcript_48251/m.138785 type:complete len:200 (+) Transcript_48251:460-1059(+)